MDSSYIVLIILGVMLILFATEKLPIATTSILACLAIAVFVEEISFVQAFAGFGNDTVFLITGMVIVGNALFETGAAQFAGEKIMSVVGKNEKVFIAVMIPACVVVSLFMNNSAATALMLPIAASAVAASGGSLSKKNTFMMVGIAVCVGGGITVVSSPPQIIAQGFLEQGGHETMGFFEIGWFGVPLVALLFLFYLTFGMKLQKKVFNFPEVEDEAPRSVPPENIVHRNYAKMLVAVGILIFCVVGFITGLWSMGVVAMTGAVLCVITGCISQKRVFEKMDWTTVVIMGASFGLAAGLEHSGAGRMAAAGIVGLLGDNITEWLLLGTIAAVSSVLTNFMSSTAAASILVPIAAFAAMEVGFDVKAAVMITAVTTNIGYATPISTPPMTMTLRGGYRFMDYVKIGGLFNLLALILVILLIPLIFGR